MTLHQFHALKVWHARQGSRHPIERAMWEAVLTLWLAGCVGGPAAFLLDRPWAELICLSVVFLPGFYVSVRRQLHRARRLRCDWIAALQ